MDETATPTCNRNHEEIPMRRVWADGRGNAVYQCPSCGRKIDVRADGKR